MVFHKTKVFFLVEGVGGGGARGGCTYNKDCESRKVHWDLYRGPSIQETHVFLRLLPAFSVHPPHHLMAAASLQKALQIVLFCPLASSDRVAESMPISGS